MRCNFRLHCDGVPTLNYIEHDSTGWIEFSDSADRRDQFVSIFSDLPPEVMRAAVEAFNQTIAVCLAKGKADALPQAAE